MEAGIGTIVRGGVSARPSARVASWLSAHDSSRIALAWLSVLVIAAPFELRDPLLRLPGQSISSVEVVVLAGLVAWLAALGRERRLPAPWSELAWWGLPLAVAAVAAMASPVSRSNALHMTVRFGLVAAIWMATVRGAADATARRRLIACVFASGAIVAVVVLADFLDVGRMPALLARFRENVAIVGAQVRASGPFQYPTIASMYLEIAFALGLGLLQAATTGLRSALLVAALAAMGEAIIVTFTRSGLIVIALAMIAAGWADWRRHGPGRYTASVAALAALVATGLLTSRSAEMLMLRLTTEGQGRWFSALVEGPASVRLDTRETLRVPLRITNTGRATWDSSAPEPVQLSYHWVAADSDAVIAWEGYRTPFPRPVRPGESVDVVAFVGSTGRPGTFRLMWDIEQEGRLWFSTEPDAVLMLIPGVITGKPTGAVPLMSGPRRLPRTATRPGRLVLWRGALAMVAAHPLLGVGPDNYRLAYGRYTPLGARADARVHSNNMYLEILAGTGLLGGALALLLGLRLARDAATAWGAPGCGPAIAIACAAVAVHGLADSFIGFTGTYILIAVALGLASACAREQHAHRV